MNKKIKAKKIKEKEWYLMSNNRFAIKSEDMLAKGAKEIPVLVYINKNTAEVKMFARVLAENIGINNVEITLKQKP